MTNSNRFQPPAPVAAHPLGSALRRTVLLPALAASAGLLARTAPASELPAWSASTRLWGPAELDLTVVLPSFNTGPALHRTVRRLIAAIDAAGASAEVLVVSDGSTDGSVDDVESIDRRVRLLVSPANRGKGAALHRGFSAARGRHVGFVDADGDISPDHVLTYWAAAVEGGCDVVYADKRGGGSEVTAPLLRRVLSAGFSMLVDSFFTLPVKDTQTGCKVYRREVLAAVLPLLREPGFAVDLEIFVAAQAQGFSEVLGLPVVIGEREAGSTVGLAAVRRTLREALSVLGRSRLGHTYTAAPVVPLQVHLSAVAPIHIPAPRTPSADSAAAVAAALSGADLVRAA